MVWGAGSDKYLEADRELMIKRVTKENEKSARTKTMLLRERSDYSAIVDRPPLKLPGGARVVFWTIVNLEVWDIGKPMARQVLAPRRCIQLPDVPNWSWHEYGMRAAYGVFRFVQARKIRPTRQLTPASVKITRASPGRRRTMLGNRWYLLARPDSES